jgi:hypothetical protein
MLPLCACLINCSLLVMDDPMKTTVFFIHSYRFIFLPRIVSFSRTTRLFFMMLARVVIKLEAVFFQIFLGEAAPPAVDMHTDSIMSVKCGVVAVMKRPAAV